MTPCRLDTLIEQPKLYTYVLQHKTIHCADTLAFAQVISKLGIGRALELKKLADRDMGRAEQA